jgi:tyrosyl-tRNA synthetase
MRAIEEGAAEIVPRDDLLRKLERSAQRGVGLRVKLGIDPTGPDIHLGHAVQLWKLRQFQDLGHVAVLVVGDFTGRIGDPSGKSEGRRQLTAEEVQRNLATYKAQVFKILDPARTEFTFNNDWLGRLTPTEIIHLTSLHTVARMLERDDFAQRYREGRPIFIHEFLYALFQGYDSVAVRADVELGGTEQKFNLLVGRELQREFGQEPQVAVTMPILVGIDGSQRMGKSLGNYVGIAEPARQIYGKLMSIPDAAIVDYLRIATSVPAAEVKSLEQALGGGGVNPRDVKARLAREVVALYHSPEAAAEAEGEFDRVFRQKGTPEEIQVAEFDWSTSSAGIIALLVGTGLAESNSAARRLIVQGGVSVNGERVLDPEATIPFQEELLLKVGKRRFLRVKSRTAAQS